MNRSETALRIAADGIKAFLIVAAAVPIYLIIKQSLTPELESFAWPPVWFPRRLTLVHLRAVFAVRELRSAVLLSLSVALLVALLSTLLGIVMAYAMARRSRLRSGGMGALTAGRLMPMIAVALPLVLVLTRIGLYDSPSGLGLALIHTAIAIPTTALLIFGAFAGIAREQEEAAWLDGASVPRILFTIDLPQMRGSIAAAFVLSFILSWDEFGYALLVQVTHRTLPPLLYYYTVFGDVGPASALALVMMVPALVAIILLRPLLGQAFMSGGRH
jgi:ABC-type glycerol-3-phosphate transport system permease component